MNRGEAALSDERGQAPWARALSGKEGVKRARASERGGSPWAKALSGKNRAERKNGRGEASPSEREGR